MLRVGLPAAGQQAPEWSGWCWQGCAGCGGSGSSSSSSGTNSVDSESTEVRVGE
jgi:hypothetical protein